MTAHQYSVPIGSSSDSGSLLLAAYKQLIGDDKRMLVATELALWVSPLCLSTTLC